MDVLTQMVMASMTVEINVPNTPGTVSNDGCPEIKTEDKKTLEIAIMKAGTIPDREVLC